MTPTPCDFAPSHWSTCPPIEWTAHDGSKRVGVMIQFPGDSVGLAFDPERLEFQNVLASQYKPCSEAPHDA
jgi:hypothetical protein